MSDVQQLVDVLNFGDENMTTVRGVERNNRAHMVLFIQEEMK